MKKNIKLKKALLLAVMAVFISSSAFAHTLWINLTNYSPNFYKKFGAYSKSYFGWGHRFPADGFIEFENFVDFSLVHPDGKKEKLIPNAGGFLATNLKFKKEGTYWVEAEKKSGFYTMYEKNGKVHHRSGPIEKDDDIILSLYFQEFAKALVNVGTGSRENLLKPVGHKIEMIPLENPLNLKEGDIFPVQILFKGEPARFLQVLGTYSGFTTEDDYAFATTTNRDGIANIRLLKRGNWLLRAKKKLPPAKELQEKCLNESYTATLTFEIK